MTTCEKCGAEYEEGTEHACDESAATQHALTQRLDKIEADQLARQAKQDEQLTRIADRLAGGGEPTTPSRTETPVAAATDYVHDIFDQAGYDRVAWGVADTPDNRKRSRRANLELAMMIFGGTKEVRGVPELTPPEYLRNAYLRHVFEDKDMPAPWIASDGKPVRQLDPKRAMDTAESGYGAELIGAQYVRDLWEAARNTDSIVSDIREIPMTDPTVYVPIDGALPEMLFVGENTSASASAYTTSKTASNRVTMTAKKFTIQQVWSGEMEEDSIIAFTPFLRDKLNMSSALHLGSAYLNGDTTNAGTGNINLDDANPADTKHYLAWDGIRHYWLVDATGQGVNQAAALDIGNINVIRGRLNGTDDDVDNAVGNINWGQNPRELRLVCDWDTYMALLDSDKVVTVDKYGPSATIVTGELGSLYGIPIVSPGYATKTDTDGKAVDTETSNTKGQITLFNPRGFLGGNRRGVQLFFDRIQRTDQFLFELYTRRAFTRFGGNVAAGIYNINL